MSAAATDLALADAIHALVVLEAENEALCHEARALEDRLREINDDALNRLDAIGKAHHDAIAAARREFA